MRELCLKHPICAILRNVPLEETEDYARAVFEGGVKMFEVALNSDDALSQIILLKKIFGEEAAVGAGTVTTPERCRIALDSGAEFVLTPSVNKDTIEFCLKHAIRILPGVMTPTDVDVCLSYGLNTMKLFPAGDLPENYIKSLKGPFDGTEYVAVGGVNAGNIGNFFERGFIGVGMGQNMVPREYVEKKQWEEASAYVRGLVQGLRRKSV